LPNGFRAEHCREMNQPAAELPSEVVASLVSYRWPGKHPHSCRMAASFDSAAASVRNVRCS
jgi:hypothetical protein